MHGGANSYDYCRTPRHETLDHMCACKGSILPQTCPKSETVMKLELMTQNTMKSMELSREQYEEKLAKTALELESVRQQIKSGDTSEELLQREARLESDMSRLKLQIGCINSEYDEIKNIGTAGDDSSGESGDIGLPPAIYGAVGGGFALVAVWH